MITLSKELIQEIRALEKKGRIEEGTSLGDLTLGSTHFGATSRVYHIKDSDGDYALKLVHPFIVSDCEVGYRRHVLSIEVERHMYHRFFGIGTNGETDRYFSSDSEIPKTIVRCYDGYCGSLLFEYFGETPDTSEPFMGKDSIDPVVMVAYDMLKALHYIHTFTTPDGRDRHIIHRDVKPSNLLISSGSKPFAKLFDFGLAIFEDSEIRYNFDGTQVYGTLPYQSPEQHRCESLLTPATDIFSLGATLYECLVGKANHPYLNDEGGINWSGIANGKFLPITDFVDVPKWLCDLVVSMMHDNPVDRIIAQQGINIVEDNFPAVICDYV
jgi:serine/threonine protein kinase